MNTHNPQGRPVYYKLNLHGYLVTPCPHGMTDTTQRKMSAAMVGGYTCCNCPHYRGINVIEKCVMCNY